MGGLQELRNVKRLIEYDFELQCMEQMEEQVKQAEKKVGNGDKGRLLGCFPRYGVTGLLEGYPR